MPASYGWPDVNSGRAVWELSNRDAAGNAAKGEAVFVDTRGSSVPSEKQLVALLGLDNVVVVTSTTRSSSRGAMTATACATSSASLRKSLRR